MPSSRLPLASSCSRTMRQKLSAASRLPLGGRLLAKQGGEGQLHFRFKILNNSAIPFSIFPLAFLFFAFSLGGEKREKTYGSGNPCRIAAQRQSRQVEWREAPREVCRNSRQSSFYQSVICAAERLCSPICSANSFRFSAASARPSCEK